MGRLFLMLHLINILSSGCLILCGLKRIGCATLDIKELFSTFIKSLLPDPFSDKEIVWQDAMIFTHPCK